MTPNQTQRTSRPDKTARLSLASRLAQIRCPLCNTLQPLRQIMGTNPHSGQQWADAHACAGCDTPLRLTGEGRLKRFFLLMAPTFLISAAIGFWLVIKIDALSTFNEGRGHIEPNLIGLLLVIALVITPAQITLLRFEKVAPA